MLKEQGLWGQWHLCGQLLCQCEWLPQLCSAFLGFITVLCTLSLCPQHPHCDPNITTITQYLHCDPNTSTVTLTPPLRPVHLMLTRQVVMPQVKGKPVSCSSLVRESSGAGKQVEGKSHLR